MWFATGKWLCSPFIKSALWYELNVMTFGMKWMHLWYLNSLNQIQVISKPIFTFFSFVFAIAIAIAVALFLCFQNTRVCVRAYLNSHMLAFPWNSNKMSWHSMHIIRYINAIKGNISAEFLLLLLHLEMCFKENINRKTKSVKENEKKKQLFAKCMFPFDDVHFSCISVIQWFFIMLHWIQAI